MCALQSSALVGAAAAPPMWWAGHSDALIELFDKADTDDKDDRPAATARTKDLIAQVKHWSVHDSSSGSGGPLSYFLPFQATR